VAKTFLRCLEAPYQGAKAYNLRGAVVDIAEFHRELCAVEPAAAELITCGERQIAIAYDLDDSALQRDLGPLPRTPLAEGIHQTLELFRRLHAAGRLRATDPSV
jgi:nucleoside-diphosphate-sugar epimerase